MKPHSGLHQEPAKPSKWNEKDHKSIAVPTYQDIEVTFIPGPGSTQSSTYPSLDFNSDSQPVVQGVPVTAGDQVDVVQLNRSSNRLFWSYRRSSQNFICLNVCYNLVLIVLINASFSGFTDNEDVCPNFAKANLFLGILSIIWICCNLVGIYAAIKRSDKFLKAYITSLFILFVLTIGITAFGLLSQDDDCDNHPHETISLVGSALLAVFILGLFGYATSRLRKMLIGLPSGV